MEKPTVGIIGAGKLGTALAGRVEQAGYPLLMTGRPGNEEMTKLVVGATCPQDTITSYADLAARADIVILALKQDAVAKLDFSWLHGIVIDATNPWSNDSHTADTGAHTWELAKRYPKLGFVKAFNHIAYADFLTDARPAGAPGRRAILVAGQDMGALKAVSDLTAEIGFDPVAISADFAHVLAMDGPLFGRKLTRADLEAELQGLGVVPVDVEVAAGV